MDRLGMCAWTNCASSQDRMIQIAPSRATSALRPFFPQLQTQCCSGANIEMGHKPTFALA